MDEMIYKLIEKYKSIEEKKNIWNIFMMILRY